MSSSVHPLLSRGPNQPLIGVPHSRARLATPALLLDLDALEANIRNMAAICRERGLKLRPHAKTHKNVRIARKQVEAGAVGICVATPREAEIMMSAGIAGVHLTSPIANPTSAETLVDAIDWELEPSIVIDSPYGLDLIENELRRRGKRLRALVDVDLGTMYRTGVATVDALLSLAAAIDRSHLLEYMGIQFYSGIVQHVPDSKQRALFYTAELERLKDAVAKLEAAGLEPETVTGGGTGTFLLDAESGVFTENQAGSYVFMDMEYAEVDHGPGLSQPFARAISIQSTVISTNAASIATIDAGSKCFSSDGPVPRLLRGAADEAIYMYFGDEFGAVLVGELAKRFSSGAVQPSSNGKSPYEQFHDLFDSVPGSDDLPEVGAKVELMVPHCDPTINLHDEYHCVRGDMLVDIWPIDARGSL